MARWSDGIERSERFEGSALHRSIQDYFEVPLEEELIGLRWDNEWMKARLAELKLERTRAAAA